MEVVETCCAQVTVGLGTAEAVEPLGVLRADREFAECAGYGARKEEGRVAAAEEARGGANGIEGVRGEPWVASNKGTRRAGAVVAPHFELVGAVPRPLDAPCAVGPPTTVVAGVASPEHGVYPSSAVAVFVEPDIADIAEYPDL